jgi:hypothetical protein
MIRILVFAGIPAVIIAASARFIVHNPYQLIGVAAAGVGAYLGLMYAAGELEEVKDMIRHARMPRAATSDGPAVEHA